MRLRLTVRETGGNTQVLLRLPGDDDPTPFGPPLPFTPPLTIPDFEDLRFYLEDYASLPVGEFAVRGERVEREKLAAWGEALFAAVFGGGAERGEAYLRARLEAERGELVEVAVCSNDPHFLAIPWELMKAPGERDPLSLRVASFDRSLLVANPARQFASAAEGFRVLMVIARPDGIRDAPFQAVARPLFKHLERNKSAVQIEVLRPPSFKEFRQRLKAAKEAGKPYHAVHFDGHGSFEDLKDGAGPQGLVLFEGETGGRRRVAARDFAAALKEGGVPLVILNACQSGKIETAEDAAGPEASVATRLLQDGAASVVAMSHSVYVVAAAAFMAAFYEELFAGKSVSEAVHAGRKALRLEKNRLRPSLKGDIPLQDWIVPVHYARSVLRLPQGETKPAPTSPAEETAAKVLGAAKIDEGHTADDLAANDGVFFGRDAEFFILERAIRTHGCAIVHGVGGTGKTELANAFARWLQISGGLDDPRLVFFHSFEPGLPTFGLDLVVNEIMAHFGDPKAYLEAGTTRERAELALRLFHEMRCLLIWDNFETVASMPEPGQATPPLDEAKKAELLWFIGELRKSKSALLITSRSEERWLGGPEVFVRCKVGGLSDRDALQYADHLLAPHAQASARRAAEPKAFKELIDYLGGHPLSLKLILPHLSEAAPSALLARLNGQGALPASFSAAEGRLESLGASLYYSFRHLPEEDQRRLVILSLFKKIASAGILAIMENPPARFQGIDPGSWNTLLKRLSGFGLLASLGDGLYRLHPALPPYLWALWQSQTEAAEDAGSECEAALRSLIGAAATFAVYLDNQIAAGKAPMALAQIAALRSSLGAFLAAALERRLFAEAQNLSQALDEFWDVSGLASEAAAWGDRIIKTIELDPGQAPEIETPAHNFWLFIRANEGNRAYLAGDLARAEYVFRHIMEGLEGQSSDKAKQGLIAAYSSLGNIAYSRGRLLDAKSWYQRGLVIAEVRDDQRSIAGIYHQLGVVAQNGGRFNEAEDWHNKSLGIKSALGDESGIAASYHQLGNIAVSCGRSGEAESWYKKSLPIYEVLNDQPHMAASYQQLGAVAQECGRLDEAERWYKKALEIAETLGDQPRLSGVCHQLGVVAQHRGRLDEAEGWCKKAVAIREALNDQPNLAITCHQLGIVAQRRGDQDEAERWYRKALTLDEALDNQPGMARSFHQLGNVAYFRGHLTEAEDLYRKALAINEALGDEPNAAKARQNLSVLKAVQSESAP
jgi:tetratricopeptide (TPR) repeat protein